MAKKWGNISSVEFIEASGMMTSCLRCKVKLHGQQMRVIYWYGSKRCVRLYSAYLCLPCAEHLAATRPPIHEALRTREKVLVYPFSDKPESA